MADEATPNEVKPKKKHRPRNYIAIKVKRGENPETNRRPVISLSPVLDEAGEFRLFEAHRKDEVLQELVDDEYLSIEADGKSEFTMIIPDRYIEEVRAVVKTRRTIAMFDG